MEYKFNDDTLIHSIGFNPMKLEGILRFGIIAHNFARMNSIPYSRNYNFTLDDEMLKKIGGSKKINKKIEEANKENIYLVRSLYISDDPLSAYNMYVRHGISFIVEDVPFIYDKNQEIIKRSDEVVVKNHVPSENIKAIMIPEEYKNKKLNEVEMFNSNTLNFSLIKDNVINLMKYLMNYNCDIDLDEVAYLLNDLKTAYLSINSLTKDHPDFSDAMADYKDIINDINSLFNGYVYDLFSKMLNKEVTVMDLVEYMNNKYDNKNIVFLDNKGRKR